MTISQAHEARQSCFRTMDMGPLPTAQAMRRPSTLDHSHGWSMQGQPIMCPADCGECNCPSSNTGAIAQLEKAGQLHPYAARIAVIHHGEPANSVLLVRRGKLKVSLISRRGRCVVFRFAVPGDLLGCSSVLNQTDHEFAAQTMEPSILLGVPRNRFLLLLQTSREVNSFAMNTLARDHDAMLRGIRRLGMSASIRERLAQLLLNCLELPRTDCLPLSIRMNWTYGELADMVSSSRETVTRIMRQFEREELIARRGSLVIIRNPARLKILAS